LRYYKVEFSQEGNSSLRSAIVNVKIAVALAVLFLGPIARADGGSVDVVTVNLTIPAFLESDPTTEQFQATFDFDTATNLATPISVSSTGPFGPFTSFFQFSAGQPRPAGGPDVGWFDAAGDNIQFDYSFDHNIEFSLGPGGSEMFWQCASAACDDTFAAFGMVVGNYDVTAASVRTPEPSAWMMLAMGIVALLSLKRVSATKTVNGL
jgi:hypothetical protein